MAWGQKEQPKTGITNSIALKKKTANREPSGEVAAPSGPHRVTKTSLEVERQFSSDLVKSPERRFIFNFDTKPVAHLEVFLSSSYSVADGRRLVSVVFYRWLWFERDGAPSGRCVSVLSAVNPFRTVGEFFGPTFFFLISQLHKTVPPYSRAVVGKLSTRAITDPDVP